ncbi:ELWxxDGT repeat protein [Marinobacterium rhizophilum]|uniref:ELWxxDGT repeat protein n=1 Tax=Marinobacterium rhizophilum TaxID=420402 RepID=UPI000A01CEBB|nr:ELWxxDGT repeat protein [Marinobacterium rhizophilum]
MNKNVSIGLSVLILIILYAPVASSNEPYLVSDINPGGGGSSPMDTVSMGGFVYFSANDFGDFGRELWKSDGTNEGTVSVKDIFPGSSSNPDSLTPIGNKLFFVARDETSNEELWISDGTESGTFMVKDINPFGSSNIEYLTDVNGTLFFAADDGVHGKELWKSDGTEAGTIMVSDINTEFFDAGSFPEELTNVNGVLFFSAANNDAVGTELWKSDGTDAGTVLVKDLNTSYQHSGDPHSLISANGLLYF